MTNTTSPTPIPTHEPIGSHLLLKLPEVAETTEIEGEGGRRLLLHLPTQFTANAKAEVHEGTLVKAGPHVSKEFDIGDQIIYNQHTEYKVRIDDALYAFVREENVICRVPATPPAA